MLENETYRDKWNILRYISLAPWGALQPLVRLHLQRHWRCITVYYTYYQHEFSTVILYSNWCVTRTLSAPEWSLHTIFSVWCMCQGRNDPYCDACGKMFDFDDSNAILHYCQICQDYVLCSVCKRKSFHNKHRQCFRTILVQEYIDLWGSIQIKYCLKWTMICFKGLWFAANFLELLTMNTNISIFTTKLYIEWYTLIFIPMLVASILDLGGEAKSAIPQKKYKSMVVKPKHSMLEQCPIAYSRKCPCWFL